MAEQAPRLSVTASSFGYTAIDLGTLGGTDSFGYGINDAGQVVGYSPTASGWRAFFRRNTFS